MATVSLSDELRQRDEGCVERINRRLLAVAQMAMVQDVLMAEVQDELEANSKYRYTIKKEHGSLANKIHHLIDDVWAAFGKQQKDDFTLDNTDLTDMVKIWAGLNKAYTLCCKERREGDKYTMTVNPVGDVFLRSQQGWVITIPKGVIEDVSCLNKTYLAAQEKPIVVDVDFYIRDEFDKEEEVV